ncbi:MAG: CoA-binding protein [Chloroflexota bacterium]
MINATKSKILADTKTIAVVGFSSKDHRPGYYVPAYLANQGYRIVPVNPNLDEGLGQPAFANLGDIPFPVDLVLIFQRSENVPPFVNDAIDIGAKSVWMQLGIANEDAARKAREAGLDVVMDSCMMVDHRLWLND